MLNFADMNLLGWVVRARTWLDPAAMFGASASGTAKTIGGWISPAATGWICLVLSWLGATAVLAVGAKLMRVNVADFVKAFTLVFFVAYICYGLGNYAYIAVAPTEKALAAAKIKWSIGLSGEAGYIVALLVGIIIGNFMPGLAEAMRPACRPEMFVKIAIIIMGAELGVKAAEAVGLAGHVVFRGLCAIVEAYLIYWAAVYYVSRKYFKFSREWAAPLASGISICGVSAAIATGGAIRARPVVPIMVSSLVVVFTCIEMLILPFIAAWGLHTEPLVAGGWMGLAVKSDGGAIASGAITESFILAKAAAEGINYKAGWVVMVTTTVKIFIDIFIGIWSMLLAYIWCTKLDPSTSSRSVSWGDVLDRFPRFVIGYVLTFLVLLVISLQSQAFFKLGEAMTRNINSLRVLFFLMTFFTIGVISNFRRLWAEGIGRLAAVYCVCLFGFIIWIGLFISWLFFHGIKPPLA
jgi:uncharacterized membrane protein YadS